MFPNALGWRLGITLCMPCHSWTHGRSREGRPSTPHPLWRRCMWSKYGEYPWADCNTFGHRRQVQHGHLQVIWWHLRAAGTHCCRPAGRVRKDRRPQDPGMVGRDRRSQLVALVRLDRGPLDLGVVDGARCCQKVQLLLAVQDLNPASHPIQLL